MIFSNIIMYVNARLLQFELHIQYCCCWLLLHSALCAAEVLRYGVVVIIVRFSAAECFVMRHMRDPTAQQ